MAQSVLVTGISGFIGGYVAEELFKAGYTVYGIDKKSPNGKVCDYIKKFYLVDVCDVDSELPFIENKIDFIIHLASQTEVQFSQKFPELDLQNNVLSTLKMCRLAKRYDVKRIVFSSSASVYGKSYYATEDDKVQPISNYGTSKASCEFYIQNYGVNYTIFRFSNVYGYGNDKGIIPILFECSNKNKEFLLNGSGKKTRDFIYVGDVSKYLVESLELQEFNNEIVNISTSASVSLDELIKMICDITGKSITITNQPEIDGDIKDSRLSNTKLRDILESYGIKLILTHIQDGLSKMHSQIENCKLQYLK